MQSRGTARRPAVLLGLVLGLATLAALLVALLPGHGPELPSAGLAATQYLAHRQARLEQVRAAVAAGAATPQAVVDVVYADVDPVLWGAAELSVRAQIDYLRHHG